MIRPGGLESIGAVVQVLDHPGQLARLMPDLGDEGRHTHRRVDFEARHRCIQGRHKKARDLAGLGEDLQQLLLKERCKKPTAGLVFPWLGSGHNRTPEGLLRF